MANCYIDFKCTQQLMQRTDNKVVAAGAAGCVYARFELCEKWAGLTTCARFEYGQQVFDVQIIDNAALIPHEVMQNNGFNVAVFGEDGSGARLTSNQVFVPVERSIDIEGVEPIPSSPSLIQQFFDEAQAAADIAASVREDADAGMFDGAPGEQGEQGEPGEGVPAGGSFGQVLAKATETDYDTRWIEAHSGLEMVTTTGTGSAYKVTSETVTAEPLNGARLMVIPHLTSSVLAPTLSVNNGTPYPIKRRLSTDSGDLQTLTSLYVFKIGDAIELMFDEGGGAWLLVNNPRVNVSDLYGTLPISSGGTGATTAAAARTSLGITPANIGAAATSHTHSTADITSGTLGIARGGTGATTAAAARTSLGITPANIGAAPATGSGEYYGSTPSRTANTVLAAPNGSDGSGGFRRLVVNDLPVVSIAKGGTGATTAAAARSNLGAWGTGEDITIITNAALITASSDVTVVSLTAKIIFGRICMLNILAKNNSALVDGSAPTLGTIDALLRPATQTSLTLGRSGVGVIDPSGYSYFRAFSALPVNTAINFVATYILATEYTG